MGWDGMVLDKDGAVKARAGLGGVMNECVELLQSRGARETRLICRVVAVQTGARQRRRGSSEAELDEAGQRRQRESYFRQGCTRNRADLRGRNGREG